MDEKRDHPNKHAASYASKNTKKSPTDGRLSAFMTYMHSANMLQFLLGCSQVVLGVGIVTIAVLGLIRPFWLSTLFSIAGSIATMIGIYVCYSALSAWGSGALLRDAMRRIVEAQN